VDAELERRLLQVLLAVMSRGPSIVTAVHRLPAVIFYLIASLAPSLIKEGPLVHLRHVQYSPASSVTEDGAAPSFFEEEDGGASGLTGSSDLCLSRFPLRVSAHVIPSFFLWKKRVARR
jgi:hypothetical protein